MISLIEALNFRCLRYIEAPLKPFHVMVGPNASGKTTFFDVVGFLQCLVSEGLDRAVFERTTNFSDLVWRRADNGFELAIEAVIPEDRREGLENPNYDTVRYEVGIRLDDRTQEIEIVAEQGILKVTEPQSTRQTTLFPMPDVPPPTIVTTSGRQNTRRLFNKTPGGNDYYYAEAHSKDSKGGRWRPAFKLGPRKSTLGNLPEDETNYPASTWFKRLLSEEVEMMVLNSLAMRRASAPGLGSGFRPDGSNLPWVVANLEEKAPHRLEEWVGHLRTALPDLQSIRSVLREDDRHRYLKLSYANGLEVPSWMVSDGTLRLMALTLPAYFDELKGVYLIEEPENGIHPGAVEAMYQSLSSVYDSQILMATHSPVILAISDADHVLCFARTDEGATDIVLGSEHPRLRDWHGEVDLGTLFASGVLG